MRLLGILVLAVAMYFAVPLLWQRAMVNRVNEMSANSADIPVGNAVVANFDANLMKPQNIVTVVNDEELARARVNEMDQQRQAAQDRVWAATH